MRARRFGAALAGREVPKRRSKQPRRRHFVPMQGLRSPLGRSSAPILLVSIADLSGERRLDEISSRGDSFWFRFLLLLLLRLTHFSIRQCMGDAVLVS